jgi:hypothetical protein
MELQQLEFFITINMGKEIEYEWISDGINQEISSVLVPDIGLELSGFAELTNGKVTVNCYHAGKAVILTRNQDNTTAIGNVYIYSPSTIEGVSFEIRSTNVSDNGTVYWQIVE